jgi:tRNA dimethylallyltransferase
VTRKTAIAAATDHQRRAATTGTPTTSQAPTIRVSMPLALRSADQSASRVTWTIVSHRAVPDSYDASSDPDEARMTHPPGARRPPRPLLVIVGTNASGKSELGVRLARQLDGEVVSADSRQVYTGLDIGTGKLTLADRAGVPHHMIDIVEPHVRYSVADFQAAAFDVIDDIHRRHRLPILVGGTGLYVDAVVRGYHFPPVPPDQAARRALEETGVDALLQRLRELDPAAADQVDTRNTRRLVRAVELSQAGVSHADTRRQLPRYAALTLGLTWPRDVLRARIARRLADRLDAGMVDEARRLLHDGVSPARLDELGLEYRHLARYLDGGYASQQELVDNLEPAIARFAKRQWAWFKRDPQTHWLDTSADYPAEALTLAAPLRPRPTPLRPRPTPLDPRPTSLAPLAAAGHE